MKTLLLILAAFGIAITALHAADPVVIVTSTTTVTVDGVAYGKPADAIANNKALAPLIQVALEDYAQQLIDDRAKAETELAQLKTRIDSTLQGLLAEELTTGDGPRAGLLRKLIAEAGKSDAELKRAALEDEIAAKQKELEALKP